MFTIAGGVILGGMGLLIILVILSDPDLTEGAVTMIKDLVVLALCLAAGAALFLWMG